MSNNTQNMYLKKAKLSGYKSIRDTEVEFNNGLNIIIGKNAAGKTNLVEFLNVLISGKLDEFVALNCRLNISGIQDYNLDILKEMNFKTLTENDVFSDSDQYKNIPVKANIIKFGIPNDYFFIEESVGFDFLMDGVSQKLFKYGFSDFNVGSFFSKNVFKALFSEIIIRMNKSQYQIDYEISEALKKVIENYSSLKIKLRNFSPIKDFRLNKQMSGYFDSEKEIYQISNLHLEFFVDEQWLPFSCLSDGSKRMFYLISELYVLDDSNSTYSNKEKKLDNIIFIEEPELGIHPHQLMQLMELIKEESKTKQIIVTTHSPLVLDVLDSDELDNILIASYNKEKKSSDFKHLSEEEKEKAQLYMKDEAYLSDYWKYSDLEK